MGEFPWIGTDRLLTEQARHYSALVSDGLVAIRRHRLEAARNWLLLGGSVLFFGPAGGGKTAAIDVMVAGVPDRRVLRCAPEPAGAVVPYRTLADLLSTLAGRDVAELTTAQSETLDRIRSREGGLAVDPGSACRAVVALLRSLARARQTVVVVDGLQWVDAPSADVLRFAAAYVEDRPVQMVASERMTDSGLPRGCGFCPPPSLSLRLDALPEYVPYPFE